MADAHGGPSPPGGTTQIDWRTFTMPHGFTHRISATGQASMGRRQLMGDAEWRPSPTGTGSSRASGAAGRDTARQPWAPPPSSWGGHTGVRPNGGSREPDWGQGPGIALLRVAAGTVVVVGLGASDVEDGVFPFRDFEDEGDAGGGPGWRTGCRRSGGCMAATRNRHGRELRSLRRTSGGR